MDWLNLNSMTKKVSLTFSGKVLLFFAIFKIWKQNLPLKRAISDVFLPDFCQLRSRHIGKFVHATEGEFFDQIVANLP